MKTFKRSYYLDKIEKELPNTDTILFLIWARQVGKTTLLQSLKDFKYINPEQTLSLYGDDMFWKEITSWKEFLQYCENFIDLDNLKYLIIDEAQYITNIGIILKWLIDTIRRWDFTCKVIVSWSWSLNIFKWMTDSLIWRKEILYVHTFSFNEFLEYKWVKNLRHTEWNIKTYLSYFNEYILRWGYPKVLMTKNIDEKKRILINLINDYVLKDVSLLLKSNEILKFKNFLQLMASKIWSTITIQNILDEIWVSRYVAEKYLFVVQNTFLLHTIHPFVGKKVSGEIKKKIKLYCNDIGLLRFLLWGKELIGEFKWKVIENFVANNLLIHKKEYEELLFWCTKSWTEVDFIIQDQFTKKIIPIEVKSRNKNNLPKSFSSFIDSYKEDIIAGYITTESEITKRELWNTTIHLLPFLYTHNLP